MSGVHACRLGSKSLRGVGDATRGSPGMDPGSGAAKTLPLPPSAQGAFVGSIGSFFCAGACKDICATECSNFLSAHGAFLGSMSFVPEFFTR